MQSGSCFPAFAVAAVEFRLVRVVSGNGRLATTVDPVGRTQRMAPLLLKKRLPHLWERAHRSRQLADLVVRIRFFLGRRHFPYA